MTIETLFRTHVDALYNVAFRVLWSRVDAEDAVQRAFVKAVTRLDQLNEPNRMRPWLLQIVYRESIAILRSRRDIPNDPGAMPEQADLAPGPAELAIAKTIADTINQALNRMHQEERVAVVLRDIEGLAMREVAEVLGIGNSAAKMRVHRGRAALRVLLSDQEVLR